MSTTLRRVRGAIGALLLGLLAWMPQCAMALTSTTTSLSSNLNPAYVSQPVTLTATVTGSSPTGSVTFKDGATTLATTALSSGTATLGWSFTTAAVHSITATYNGDANNATSTSVALSQTVNPKNTTTTTLTSNLNPANFGQTVALTATVTGSSPTGSVTFRDGANVMTVVGLSAGSASVSWSFSTAAAHSLTAVYNGDVANATSTSPALTQTINAWPTTTGLSCPSGTTVMVGVNCTVTVSVAASTAVVWLGGQTVKIVENNTTVGTGTLAYVSAPGNYSATIALAGGTAPVSVVGSHTLQAQYTATSSTAASNSSNASLAVQQRVSSTSLAANPTTAGSGQYVTLTATVTGTSPGGTVTFNDGATPVASGALVGGQVAVDVQFSSTGTHSLTANYAGDTNNTSSTSASLSETVNSAVATTTMLAASANPIDAGQSATLTATVSGSNPTGMVVFQDGAATLGSATLSGGQATLTPSFSSAGNHALTATYRGDTGNAASTSSAFTLAVNQRATTTTLAAAPNVAYQGQTVALSATVAGANPSGTVTFKEGATTIGTASVSGGTAVLNTAFSIVGNHSVAASYAGDANNVASTSGSATVQTLVGPVPAVSAAPVVNYEYDAQGNPTKAIQAPGVAGFNFSTVATYDALNRMKDTTNAKSGKTQIGYDGLDRTTKVTDPRSLITQYPRNGLGDATQLISPDTGTASITYDEAGNIKTRTDSRGVLATYGYDALNRLTSLAYTQSGQPSQGFGWQYDLPGVPNSVGRLGAATHPGGSTGYTYDAQGRVLTTVQQVSATTGANAATLSHTVGYAYDSAGNITGITYPSGRKVVIGYSGGRPSSIGLANDATSAASPLLSQIQWQPFGAVKSWLWETASGQQLHERIYDTSGRLARYRLGTMLRDVSYDAGDRITSYKHYDATNGNPQTGSDQTFGYDELGRLTSVTTATASWSLTYDANGNRTGVTLNGSASGYTISGTSNRMSSISNPTRTFGYDNTGNTTADGNYTATYDLSGRLASLTKAGVTTTYTYNSQGQRVRKFGSSGVGSTAVFVYDQNGRLLGEYDQSGSAIREYVWLGSTPVAMFLPDPANVLNPPVVYFIQADHIDTPRVVVNKNNAIRWRWMAEPFGTTAPEADPSGLGVFTQNLRFPGQYFDQESGLHYNYYRSYDPGLGRYTQSDPIGIAGGLNTYGYAGSNAAALVDSSGLAIGDFPPPPPGYSPGEWPQGYRPKTGRFYLIDPEGRVWTAHPEDREHWRHWDKQKPDGSDDHPWPPNSGKPRPNQKKLKKQQCAIDPNGDAPPWTPLDPDLPDGDPFELSPYLPEWFGPRPTPQIRVPIRVPTPGFVF